MPMSQNIINEVTFLLHSFLLGAVITVVYDVFLILRRLVRHNLFLVSLEDLVFWISCAIGVFYMLYEENNGILRWFAVFGAGLGMVVYKKCVGNFLVDLVAAAIGRILRAATRILGFIFRPVRFAGRKVKGGVKASARKGKKAGRWAKNKIKERMKVLKMTLCRH
ncbi:hypothetical protein IMSAGC019_00037 [Lachnospiraceae bacterium]|nr:hypothetical protein IMSAGC019_00037 [Lachnospiraceae bacterium]